MLEKEFQYFKQNRNELVKTHLNEYVVIKGEEIIGFFPSEEKALRAMSEHELGTFIVQQCIPEDLDIYKYHSRVAFT